MKINNATKAGTLCLVGGIQWFMGLLMAESWYPGYSSRIDYVSDLGVGPTALLYNVSVFLLGACITVGAYFILVAFDSRVLAGCLTLTGIGAMGVGLFPANMQPMHSVFTLVAIMFGAFSSIVSYRVLDPPLSYASILLGLLSLGAAVIFMPYLGLPIGDTTTYLGMAKGSMERWAINPILAWIIAFGGHLISNGRFEH